MLLECVDILKWRQGNNKGLLIEGVGGREGGSGVRTTRRCGPCSPSKQVHVDADAASLDGDQPREPHEETRKKKKKEKKKTKPSAVEPKTICMHENLRSVAVSFISVMADHHPRKILSRRPCYFWRGGMLDAAPRVRRLDAFSGSGPCQGSPRVWPVFRLLHGEVFCGD